MTRAILPNAYLVNFEDEKIRRLVEHADAVSKQRRRCHRDSTPEHDSERVLGTCRGSGRSGNLLSL